MQLGQRSRQVVGLAICALAFVVAALVPRGESTTPSPALRGISAAVETGAESTGALAATVTWPAGAAERSDICVVVFDEDGGVAEELVGGLEPVPGQPDAGRWTAEGLAAGRYTVHAAPCVKPAEETRAQVEPQYLCGGDDAEAACWVEVASGDRVDVDIALRRSGR
jgi:hypothetical protein